MLELASGLSHGVAYVSGSLLDNAQEETDVFDYIFQRPGDLTGVGLAAAHAHVKVTHLGDRAADFPILVSSPFHGTLHPTDITSNVIGHGPPPLRRHKTSWTEHSSEFWGDRTKEFRYTKDGGRVVMPVNDLGRNWME